MTWHCHNCGADFAFPVWGTLDYYGELDEAFCPECDSTEIEKTPLGSDRERGRSQQREVEDARVGNTARD